MTSYFHWIALLTALLCRSVVAQIYVSPDGDDGFSGTASRPVQTLERAQSIARNLRQNSSAAITVTLLNGVYELNSPLLFEAADSGTEIHPITWQAKVRGAVRISGAIAITAKEFGPVASDPSADFPIDSVPHLKVMKLPGIFSDEDLRLSLARAVPGQKERPGPVELIVNHEPMMLSRWPNKGWTKTGHVASSSSLNEIRFLSTVSRLRNWIGPNVWAKGYWQVDWYDETLPIGALDVATKSVTVTGPAVYGVHEGRRFVVLNAPGELDEPGEYYIDRASRKLIFWPPASLSGAYIELTHIDKPLIEFRGTSNVNFDGIIIENGRSAGIKIEGGRHVHLTRCQFRNLGGDGVEFQDGQDDEISYSLFKSIGLSAVVVNGGNREKLVGANYRILKNDISDTGSRIAAAHPAIDVRGVGTTISGNSIHDIPQSGIVFLGNNHLIENNRITNVCSESSDCGAIYTGRDWTVRGTAIRNNTFENIRGNDGKGDVSAVYLDDLASGTIVKANHFENIKRGVLIGGGRDNQIIGNYFSHVDIPVSIDARGLHWARNLLAKDGEMVKRLERVPYHSPKWRKSYPQLISLLEDDPGLPKHNIVSNNLMLQSGTMEINPIARWYGKWSKNRIIGQTEARDK